MCVWIAGKTAAGIPSEYAMRSTRGEVSGLHVFSEEPDLVSKCSFKAAVMTQGNVLYMLMTSVDIVSDKYKMHVSFPHQIDKFETQGSLSLS